MPSITAIKDIKTTNMTTTTTIVMNMGMITIITITTIMDTITITVIKVYQWRQLSFMPYVQIILIIADVIQSIGLIISSLIIFFAGSDMGK